MAVVEETKTIKIRHKVNYICPYCGKAVDPNDVNAMMVRPRGSKVDQWKHISCMRFSNG